MDYSVRMVVGKIREKNTMLFYVKQRNMFKQLKLLKKLK